MVQLIWCCPLVTLGLLGMTGNWICMDLSGTNYDANAKSFVKNQVMWVIYPEILSVWVFVCVRMWMVTIVDSGHVSESWFIVDVAYSSLCKGWDIRKRVLFWVKHECAFPEWSCCAWCRTERLCGQKNNADPFALLSYKRDYFQQGDKERWLCVSNNIPTQSR